MVAAAAVAAAEGRLHVEDILGLILDSAMLTSVVSGG